MRLLAMLSLRPTANRPDLISAAAAIPLLYLRTDCLRCAGYVDAFVAVLRLHLKRFCAGRRYRRQQKLLIDAGVTTPLDHQAAIRLRRAGYIHTLSAVAILDGVDIGLTAHRREVE